MILTSLLASLAYRAQQDQKFSPAFAIIYCANDTKAEKNRFSRAHALTYLLAHFSIASQVYLSCGQHKRFSFLFFLFLFSSFSGHYCFSECQGLGLGHLGTTTQLLDRLSSTRLTSTTKALRLITIKGFFCCCCNSRGLKVENEIRKKNLDIKKLHSRKYNKAKERRRRMKSGK